MAVFRSTILARRGALAVTCAALSALSLTGCAGNAASTPPPAPTTSGTADEFVAEIPELDAFVAVIADEPTPDAPEGAVRAYLCDGKGLGAWFPAGPGTTARLQAADGEGTLDVAVTPEAATGTIALSDGRTAAFQAHPALGPAGMFTVDLLPSGELRGTSADGDRLQGRIEGPRPDAGFAGSGTITTAEEDTPFVVHLTSTAPFTGRAVFLEDGRSRGRSVTNDARRAIWA